MGRYTAEKIKIAWRCVAREWGVRQRSFKMAWRGVERRVRGGRGIPLRPAFSSSLDLALLLSSFAVSGGA